MRSRSAGAHGRAGAGSAGTGDGGGIGHRMSYANSGVGHWMSGGGANGDQGNLIHIGSGPL